MRATCVRTLVGGLAAAALIGSIATVESRAAAHQNPANAGNPVAATPESVAAGMKTYQRYCRACHGSNGEGGPQGEVGPAPSALNDATWDKGSSDAAIFTVVKRGLGPDFFMEAWGDRIPDNDIWNVVNYLRTLTKK